MVAWALLHALGQVCAPIDTVAAAVALPKQVAFAPGHSEPPLPTPRESSAPYLRALATFASNSASIVGRSMRANPIPPAKARHRDLFPLPDLPAKLDGDPPPIQRLQARLCLGALNVMWNNGAVTPFSCRKPTTSQRSIHLLALRRAADLAQ